jgi:hypothetical protein
MNCNSRTEPDTSPPRKKEPGRATRARIAQQQSDSCVRSYHKRPYVPSVLTSLAYALPAHACKQLLKEVGS